MSNDDKTTDVKERIQQQLKSTTAPLDLDTNSEKMAKWVYTTEASLYAWRSQYPVMFPILLANFWVSSIFLSAKIRRMMITKII